MADEKKYIEVERAKTIVNTWIMQPDESLRSKLIHRDLDAEPAADVRPVVRGRWHGEADGYADGHLVYDIWSCDCCGKTFDEWNDKPDWNFCPNCGADMEMSEAPPVAGEASEFRGSAPLVAPDSAQEAVGATVSAVAE